MWQKKNSIKKICATKLEFPLVHGNTILLLIIYSRLKYGKFLFGQPELLSQAACKYWLNPLEHVVFPIFHSPPFPSRAKRLLDEVLMVHTEGICFPLTLKPALQAVSIRGCPERMHKYWHLNPLCSDTHKALSGWCWSADVLGATRAEYVRGLVLFSLFQQQRSCSFSLSFTVGLVSE